MSQNKLGDSNPMAGRKHSSETRQRMSIAQAAVHLEGRMPNQRFVQGRFQSLKSEKQEFYGSSFELRRMQFLESSAEVRSWTRHHGIRIPYEIDGRTHNYVPDFLVVIDDGTFLEEVKGWIRDERVHRAKLHAAVNFCNERGWSYRVLFKDDLETL